MTIRLVLVEDQLLFLAAFGALLALEDDIEIVGRFSSGRDAIAALPSLNAHLVITDIEMPEMDGFELARQIIQQEAAIKIIMLSTFARDGYVERVMKLGVNGYLLKESPPELIVTAIRNVMAGLIQIDGDLMRRDRSMETPLSDREQAILRFIGSGAANKEIAERLGLSSGTIRNCVSEIIAKLGAKNRIDACRIAQEQGRI